MKIHFLKSATTIVESNGIRILTDPWLVDGEYYGSWFHYPPYDLDPNNFNDIDYIYISHIHPDHFSRQTLERLDKSIPVLIHSYAAKFLKNNIERLGFQVTELPHNVRTHLRNSVFINILAADNCNPEVCAKFFGCGQAEASYGSTQIDSLTVIDDGQYSVLNLNDCPFELASHCVEPILQTYSKIDMMLVGYAGAGPYPQCVENLSEEQRHLAGQKKKQQFLESGCQYLELFRPEFFMPFAGTYILGGKHAALNPHRGVPEIEEALQHYSRHSDSQGVLLNSGESFDLASGEPSAEYRPVDLQARQQYIDEVLSTKPFEFANDPMPAPDAIQALLLPAFQRMNRVRESIAFCSETRVLIPIGGKQVAVIPMNGQGIRVVRDGEEACERFVRLTVDPRLLFRILRGPRFGHWNNAEIGSHISYFRQPETFERGLYYCMNFFYAGPPLKPQPNPDNDRLVQLDVGSTSPVAHPT